MRLWLFFALQSHLSRLPAPISDYLTDTKSALDNSVRVCQVSQRAGYMEVYHEYACLMLRVTHLAPRCQHKCAAAAMHDNTYSRCMCNDVPRQIRQARTNLSELMCVLLCRH